MKAIFTIGISGSGKSTWAAEQKRSAGSCVDITNRDELRWNISGKTGWKEYKFSRAIEEEVTVSQRQAIRLAAIGKRDIIIADTNLNEKFRNEMMDYCRSLGFEIEVKEFPVTFEEAMKRDRFRGEFSVGVQVLAKQWQQWLDYIQYKRYTPNPMKPRAVIFDADGTLFHMDGKRGPFEWNKVYFDRVDTVVKEIAEMYTAVAVRVIVMSGRDSIARQDTIKALDDNGVPFAHLWMRAEGDMRKDRIVKEELFWNHVAPHYNVIAAVDDRPQVVRLWRDLGIKTINVGVMDNEF